MFGLFKFRVSSVSFGGLYVPRKLSISSWWVSCWCLIVHSSLLQLSCVVISCDFFLFHFLFGFSLSLIFFFAIWYVGS